MTREEEDSGPCHSGIRLLITVALILAAGVSSAQTLQYLDADGKIGTTIIVAEGDGTIMITEDVDTILCGPDWSTRSVRHADPGSSSAADFVRIGDSVRITGTLRGAALDRTIDIDGSPWYMDPIAQTRPLAGPGIQKWEFWVIDVRDYRMHKLAAVPKGEEDFPTPMGIFRARRYLVTVSGLPSIVWNADVWIRVSDGICLCWNREYVLHSELW